MLGGLRRLGEGLEGARDRTKLAGGAIAAAARGELGAASDSLMRVLGSAPEPTRVEPIQRLPRQLAEGGDPTEEELHNVVAPGFFEKDFDAVRSMLESLPPDLDGPRFSRYIDEQINRHDAALDRVTHELSANVMANYGTFVTGMAQVQELGGDLVLTGLRCKSARRNLRVADAPSRNGISLIGKLRRRAAMRLVAARLEGITGAVKAAHRLQALLGAELSEQAKAPPINLLLEATALYATCAAANASHGEGLLVRLTVISELEKVHARLLTLVDDARRQLCTAFEPRAYSQLLECATSLEDVAVVGESLPSLYASAISSLLTDAARACVFEQLGIPAEAPAHEAAPVQSPAHPMRSAQPGATLPQTSADAAALVSAARSSSSATQRQKVLAANLKELVGMLHEDRVSDSFVSLIAALADVLTSHHAMLSHHQTELKKLPGNDAEPQPRALLAKAAAAEPQPPPAGAGAGKASAAPPENGSVSLREMHEVLSRGLALSRGSVWVEMQRQLSVVIVSAPTATFSVEQMLTLLSRIEAFMKLGLAFSGESATVLRASIRTKSGAFYSTFHRERVDELRMRLESELWQRVALKGDALTSSLLFVQGWAARPAAPQSPQLSAQQSSSVLDSVPGSHSFALFPSTYAPLEPLIEAELARRRARGASTAAGGTGGAGRGLGAREAGGGLWSQWEKHIKSSSSSGGAGPGVVASAEGASAQAEALGKVVTALSTGEDGRMLAVCGTALSFAKMIQRYVHVIEVLQPIASDAFLGLSGLFELVVLSVFTEFWGGPKVGSPGWDDGPLGEHLAPRLKGVLIRLHHVYIEGDRSGGHAPMTQAAVDSAAAMRSTAHRLIASLHPLSTPGRGARLGPQESICAADSLQFIANVLHAARPRLEELFRNAYGAASSQQLAMIGAFYAQTVDSVPHLQDAIRRALVRKTLDLDKASAAIAAHKWDLKEIGTNESPYVHLFVSAAKTCVTHVGLLSIPQSTVTALHTMVVELICAALVEGYATAKKCSQESRAQMSIDLKTVQAELSEMLRCSVSLERADSYVRAYYSPPDELIDWAREHSEYTTRQLVSLVNIMPLKKRERDDVLKALDELRGGGVASSLSTSTLDSLMHMAGTAGASAAASASGAAEVESERGGHARNNSSGPPRTFGSLGKWAHSAQTEAAAKLKAANAAIGATAGGRRGAGACQGADGTEPQPHAFSNDIHG